MMSLETEPTNRRSDSPCSLSWQFFDDGEEGDDDSSSSSSGGGGDGVLRIPSEHCTQAPYGCAIGHGGDRGSLVYGVDDGLDLPLCVDHPLAFKVYPVSITQNEMSFIRALFSNDIAASDCDGGERALCHKVPYLVLPMAIVTISGVDRGILMVRQDCSLKQFLFANTTTGRTGDECSWTESYNDEDDGSSFRSQVAFDPIRACEVVTAITFQLVAAIAVLNEEVPHVINGVTCRGFTHNDIHLDNILLNCSSGCISLCDFELVGHISQHGEAVPQPVLQRLPPYCRQSPHGLFCRTADTWALGLVVASLLTGVDPLFADDRLMDDFGDGPLLQSYRVSEGTVPVLDWESNIKAHVERLLQRDDPTGRRMNEAKPLMEICARCLVNRPDASPSVAVELLDEPLFSAYMESPQRAESVVRAWIEGRRAV